jgi:hypothetical protein
LRFMRDERSTQHNRMRFRFSRTVPNIQFAVRSEGGDDYDPQGASAARDEL